MAAHANASDSDKMLLILKRYLKGLETEKKFSCLESLKDFRDIIAKPKNNCFKEYTFDDLSTDFAELVVKLGKQIVFKFNPL